MIFIVAKLLLFLSIIISFGYVASSLFLRERKISILIPFSILVGLGGYMFFVNAISYLVPIKQTIWLVLVVFCIFAVYQIYTKGMEYFSPVIDFTKKELKILFGLALLVSTISGIVQLRAFDPDDRSHLIAASTISEGNFPVMSPMDPDSRLPYHYGPDLLSGAMHNVTGIPLLQNYDVQIFFFSGVTFLLAFILAFGISGNFYVSIVAALFFFYGGSSLFLNAANGFSPLYHKYVLGENVVGAWKFIADMVLPQLNHFYAYGIRSHTTAMGMPIMLAVIYLYFQFVDTRKAQIKNGIIIGLFLGSIALSLETSFVILSFVLGLTLLWRIYLLIKSKDSVVKQGYVRSIKLLVSMLVTGSIVAILQGGLITNVFLDGKIINKGQTFTLNHSPLLIPTLGLQEPGVQMTYSPVLGPVFLKEFGLLLILFPIALYIFRRDKKVLFLSVVGIVAFLLPFAVVYILTPGAMLRLFSVSTPIFAFVTAFLVCLLFDKYKENIKIKIGLITLSLMVLYAGIAFQLVCMITPWSDFGKIRVPFVANPPQSTVLDKSVYRWIQANTVNSSRFFPYSPMLIIETGRMSPGNYLALFPEYKVPIYNDIADNCGEESIKNFKIDYFVISPDGFSREDFLKKCAQENFELVFSDKLGSDYREIYQRK